MMEAAPSAPFIMAEPNLLLEFLIIALDAPTQLCGVDQIAECDVARQGRKPVPGGLLLALGPLDQQSFLGQCARSSMRVRSTIGAVVSRSDFHERAGTVPIFRSRDHFSGDQAR
jgi:hypothetical protein